MLYNNKFLLLYNTCIQLYETMYNDKKHFCYKRRCISYYIREYIMRTNICHYMRRYIMITNICVIHESVFLLYNTVCNTKHFCYTLKVYSCYI